MKSETSSCPACTGSGIVATKCIDCFGSGYALDGQVCRNCRRGKALIRCGSCDPE